MHLYVVSHICIVKNDVQGDHMPFPFWELNDYFHLVELSGLNSM